MIFDPREVRVHDPMILVDSEMEQVDIYKYLGVQMDNQLKWDEQVDCISSTDSGCLS